MVMVIIAGPVVMPVIMAVVMMIMQVPVGVPVRMAVVVVMAAILARSRPSRPIDRHLSVAAAAYRAHQSTSISLIRNSSPPVICT